LWLPVAVLGHSAIIAGQRTWWLDDDPMISMRYAKNLAQGNGLVWNSGERVEGYTNFLWILYMALVHLFPIPAAKISLVILLTNVALAAATIPLLLLLVRQLRGSPLVGVAVTAAYVLNRNLMFWTASGFESSLLTFIF